MAIILAPSNGSETVFQWVMISKAQEEHTSRTNILMRSFYFFQFFSNNLIIIALKKEWLANKISHYFVHSLTSQTIERARIIWNLLGTFTFTNTKTYTRINTARILLPFSALPHWRRGRGETLFHRAEEEKRALARESMGNWESCGEIGWNEDGSSSQKGGINSANGGSEAGKMETLDYSWQNYSLFTSGNYEEIKKSAN